MSVESRRREFDEATEKPKQKDWLLTAIAVFKLVKGVLLLLVGIGALSLVHKDVAETLTNVVDAFRVDPNNRHIHQIIVKLGVANSRKLEEVGAGTFFYSALLLTEGTGLLLKRHWAEYFTIIVTASFIPMEIYEILRRLTFTRIALLGVNVAIVVYLVKRIKTRKETE